MLNEHIIQYRTDQFQQPAFSPEVPCLARGNAFKTKEDDEDECKILYLIQQVAYISYKIVVVLWIVEPRILLSSYNLQQ